MLRSLLSGALSAVDPEDLKRVWSLMQPIASNASIGIRVIQEQCSPEADAMAVCARTALLKLLLEQGALDDWRGGDRLWDIVFTVAAAFPLDHGLQGFDPNAFIDRLQEP